MAAMSRTSRASCGPPVRINPGGNHQVGKTSTKQNNGSYLANDPHAFDVIGRQGLDLRRPLQEPLGLGYP